MLSQNSFSAKEGLTRRETHCAMASMFFACFPEVLWSEIGKDWRFSKRKCWGCITCITNIYCSKHACASSKASSTGVRLSRFKFQLRHFIESLAIVPNRAWKKNYSCIDFIIKIVIYHTTYKMKVDYFPSRCVDMVLLLPHAVPEVNLYKRCLSWWLWDQRTGRC